ncbi:lipase family protein [Sporomusa termitida]|uniref:Lipase (Class 3) n=1 Tax=Sporomusa termitida TaxID=2377 RepID=A0A517DW18_9FIRM|nr:lipase family protein [Sporomusa termitida]QDR81513.1 Lipase (class 3) [Sporomusa termitida]
MRKIQLLLLSVILFWSSAIGYAGPREDYEEAHALYIAAAASVAAYHDRVGELASRYLEQEGWHIDHYVQPGSRSGARFLLAKKENEPGKNLYVLAIVGTETTDDMKINLKFDKVYFAGSTAEEFALNAANKNPPRTAPQVHKGFNEFIQSGPSAVLRNAENTPLMLPDLLHMNPNDKLYLTGHSLGGAAATLAGARLLNLGTKAKQLQVITFGAPAIGNDAFAAAYTPILPLTRVVIDGDPVTGVLQTLVGGYKQFGREIIWQKPATINDPHKITGYVDAALKNYYDKRQLARQAGVSIAEPVAKKAANPGRVYIAPMKDNLPAALADDFWYMREALMDEYRKTLPDCLITAETSTGNWREEAVAAGCQWIIVPEVTGIRLKEQKDSYLITFHQIVLDANTGAAVDAAIFSTRTYNLTPLEAFIHTFRGINAHQATWLKER